MAYLMMHVFNIAVCAVSFQWKYTHASFLCASDSFATYGNVYLCFHWL